MKALELAKRFSSEYALPSAKEQIEMATELRRLAEVNAELLEALARCEDYIVGPHAWTQQQEDDLVEFVRSSAAKAKEQQ